MTARHSFPITLQRDWTGQDRTSSGRRAALLCSTPWTDTLFIQSTMGSLHEIRQPSRPSLTRSRSTCLVAASSSSCNHHSNNTGTGSHHKRRRRADTIFLRRRPFISASSSNVDATPPSASVLDSLDLSLPLSRHLERVRGILECSIEEAMDKLQSLQLELSSTDTDDNDDDTAGESDVDSHSSDTDPTEPVHAFMDLSPIPSTSTSTFYSSSTSKKEDYETLQAFLNDVYTLLSSIRKDLHEQLPSLPPLPQLPTMPAIIPTRFDKAAVYEHLASNYEKAQEVFFHLSLYSPLSISLPEFPASLAASISSAAKGALAAASASSTPTSSGSRTPQTAPPRSSDEANDSNTDQIHSSASSTSPSNPSTFSLPQPPLSAIRSFLISESKRLSSKLPSRPSLQDWHPSRTAIQSAINDASTFVHDEKEKLKEMLHDETEKLKQALLYGKERLLEFHELPMDWRNNKVGQVDLHSGFVHFDCELTIHVLVRLSVHPQWI